MIEIYSINHNIPNTKANWTNRCKLTLKSKINQIKKKFIFKTINSMGGVKLLGLKIFPTQTLPNPRKKIK